MATDPERSPGIALLPVQFQKFGNDSTFTDKEDIVLN